MVICGLSCKLASPEVDLDIFKQLASALCTLAYIHVKRILRRDLAARNVLVKSTKPYDVKPADFGREHSSAQHTLYTLCLCHSWPNVGWSC
jgi:serine/threonine protein kinase